MSFEWPIDRSQLPALPSLGDPVTPEAQAKYDAALAERNAAEALAIQVMWALSGRQFGLETVTARPCARGSFTPTGRPYIDTYVLTDSGWFSWPCGCSGPCRETGPNMVHLYGPVAEVLSVQVGGVELPNNVWAVEGNVLYRRDAPWPRQDLNRPEGDSCTWSVTYQLGLAVPEGVAALTGLLAKEFIDALNNEGRCRLPRTVTTATRQGVTYRAYDPAVIYANGKTGLPEIDMWLAAVNPHHLTAAPTVR